MSNFRYQVDVIDARLLRGEVLIESIYVGDNIIAVRTRVTILMAENEREEPSFDFAIMMQSDILAPAYNEGFRRGWLKGRTEAKSRAAEETIRMQLEFRFGSMPEWAKVKLTASKLDQLDRYALQLLTANNIDQALAD